MPDSSMRAAVARGKQHVEIESVPVPQPAAGEVRVRVRACGVCGSDLHLFQAGLYAPGATPGHEMSGDVDALGDGVEDFAPGEAVTIEPLHSCGACATCRAGLDAICPQLEIFGIQRPGGFAEYVSVPARRLFRAPSDLEPRLAALCEPMAVVVHSLQRGRFEAGQRVLVLGAGSVGLLAVVAARALGAGEIWLTARHPHQARLGANLGASRVLGEKQASAPALDALGREAPVDLVVETVGGSADTLDLAVAAVRPGGAISVVGVFMGKVGIDALPLFVKEGTLAWSNCYTHPHEGADFSTAVELVSAHRVELSRLTTHAVPLDEVARAYELASEKKAGTVKVTVVP